MSAGIQPWPAEPEREALLVDEAYGVGTMFGPVHGPGVSEHGLAGELRMAVRAWEPKPCCGVCGGVMRFEHIFIRLTLVRCGYDVAALCGGCLEQVYSGLRSVSHASGDDRHRRGMVALNSAFELMVMGGKQKEEKRKQKEEAMKK